MAFIDYTYVLLFAELSVRNVLLRTTNHLPVKMVW